MACLALPGVVANENGSNMVMQESGDGNYCNFSHTRPVSLFVYLTKLRAVNETLHTESTVISMSDVPLSDMSISVYTRQITSQLRARSLFF